MAKKASFKPGGQKNKLHHEMGVAPGKKIPQAQLKAAEGSKNPTVARDAKRAVTMEGWTHGSHKGLINRKK